jgi:hypothetical protein
MFESLKGIVSAARDFDGAACLHRFDPLDLPAG